MISSFWGLSLILLLPWFCCHSYGLWCQFYLFSVCYYSVILYFCVSGDRCVQWLRQHSGVIIGWRWRCYSWRQLDVLKQKTDQGLDPRTIFSLAQLTKPTHYIPHQFWAEDWRNLLKCEKSRCLQVKCFHVSSTFNQKEKSKGGIFHLCWIFFSLVRPLSSGVLPALGLTWASQVTVRLMMVRSQAMISSGNQHSALRRLEVVFGPHLACRGAHVAVWREGVRGVVRWDRAEPQHQSS